jgi:hypothetical protein
MTMGVAFGAVMAGHMRSKNGVASVAYVPGICASRRRKTDGDGQDKLGPDERMMGARIR